MSKRFTAIFIWQASPLSPMCVTFGPIASITGFARSKAAATPRRHQARHDQRAHRAETDEAEVHALTPELLRRDARAFGERRKLRPHHVRIDRRLPDPGAVAAIAARHHVLSADQLRVAADA